MGPPEESVPPTARLELYGFTMLDIGYNFGRIDPNWFDVVRPTKLPATPNEFGSNGVTFEGVRQSRFGAKGFVPTSYGELTTIFEFELFGVGADAGRTTFRLRHAYGELGPIGAGQTWSAFMDPDVFPNSIEYWGPPGMVFFRNVQLRWIPIRGKWRLMFTAEGPGGSADQSNRDQFPFLMASSFIPKFPMPDLVGQFRLQGDWGHVQVAGIVRRIEWDSVGTPVDLSGGVWGWGGMVSANLKFRQKDVIRLQAVYGEAIENYMNDADVDIAIRPTADPNRPEPVTLSVVGLVGFVDIYWKKWLSTTAGYSLVHIDNSFGQAPEAFRTGNYALVNALFYPVEDLMLGPEFQYGRRDNHSDGFSFNDYRIQISVKYNFAAEIKKSP